MIKIFIKPPLIVPSMQMGYYKRWLEAISTAPRKTDRYQIVENADDADFIVQNLSDSLDSKPLAHLLNPVSSKDVATIAWNLSDRPTGRHSGFYCSLPNSLFDPSRHVTFCYPVQFNDLITMFPLADATMDFSFIGQVTHSIRRALLDRYSEQAGENFVAIDSGNDAWYREHEEGYLEKTTQAKLRFADIMRRSKFILCPRGVGTGSFRLFEAMQSQRVPIIISDDYVKPHGIEWDKFSITLREQHIAEIPRVVAAHMDSWQEMATTAREVWEENFSPENMMQFIATQLERIAPNLRGTRKQKLVQSIRIGSAVGQDIIARLNNKFRTLLKHP